MVSEAQVPRDVQQKVPRIPDTNLHQVVATRFAAVHEAELHHHAILPIQPPDAHSFQGIETGHGFALVDVWIIDCTNGQESGHVESVACPIHLQLARTTARVPLDDEPMGDALPFHEHASASRHLAPRFAWTHALAIHRDGREVRIDEPHVIGDPQRHVVHPGAQ